VARLVIGFLLIALPYPLVQLHRIVHSGRVGLTPLAAFLASWWIIGVLYELNPLGLYSISPAAMLVIGVGLTCFVAGYAIACYPVRGLGSTRFENDQPSTTDAPLRWLLLLCVVGGSLLLVVYIASVGGVSALLGNPAATLLAIRLNLNVGDVPTGFYFFYFYTLAVPVAVVLWSIRRQPRYLLVGGFCLFALLSTTGRTNVTAALVWATIVVVMRRGSKRITPWQVTGSVGVVLVAVGIFVTLGDALGKSYDNSYIRVYYGAHPPVPQSLVLPLEQLGGAVPAFGVITQQATAPQDGALTLRPIFQLLHILDPTVKVQSKIQPFYAIPVPFNVGTYLAPLWQDGGMLGVCIGSLVTGGLCGIAYALWYRRRTLASLVLAGLFTLVALRTVGDASLNDLSTVIEISLLAVCFIAERSRRTHPVRAWPSAAHDITGGAHV
jgi:oligosaccharide repeat unit polymerase